MQVLETMPHWHNFQGCSKGKSLPRRIILSPLKKGTECHLHWHSQFWEGGGGVWNRVGPRIGGIWAPPLRKVDNLVLPGAD